MINLVDVAGALLFSGISWLLQRYEVEKQAKCPA